MHCFYGAKKEAHDGRQGRQEGQRKEPETEGHEECARNAAEEGQAAEEHIEVIIAGSDLLIDSKYSDKVVRISLQTALTNRGQRRTHI
jgi:hypothetical protein